MLTKAELNVVCASPVPDRHCQDKSASSTRRLRQRLELLVPLNKEKLTTDGARYLMADWEWFVSPDDVAERFANSQRIRTGLGYRPSLHWHFEALYIWTRSRNTAGTGFTTSDNISSTFGSSECSDDRARGLAKSRSA